jgi:NAD(P)-dependent dehydrogenase (short-subunit alcohol dehydrogenase family)
MTSNFSQTVAIVTGGGSGIGRAAALQLAQAGCHVLITGRSREPLAALAKESNRIDYFVADMTRESDLIALVQKAISQWGRLDILVNNAGMFGLSPIETLEADFMQKMLVTNVIGPSLLIRESIPALAQTQGTIINVSSTNGHKAVAGVTAYAASKAALEHLTKCLALELAAQGIRVNGVAPGPTETDILSKSGLTSEMIQQSNEAVLQAIPLGRRGRAKEVADWIVKLADPSASWLTGVIIDVDGGLSAA